jgi:hypothetical protein
MSLVTRTDADLADRGTRMVTPNKPRDPYRIAMRDGTVPIDPRLSTSWERGITTLKEAVIYPLPSPEYRAASQRAYQYLKEASISGSSPSLRAKAADVADRLAVFLEIDWTRVDEVEVRYHDGSTEFLRVADDPDAARKLNLAAQVRFPDSSH